MMEYKRIRAGSKGEIRGTKTEPSRIHKEHRTHRRDQRETGGVSGKRRKWIKMWK